MIFKIRRVNESTYYKHSQTGETSDWAHVPKHSRPINNPRFINDIAWSAPDGWEKMSGPMPIPGVNGDTVELNTINDLLIIALATGYPVIVTHCNDPDHSWEVKVYDDFIE